MEKPWSQIKEQVLEALGSNAGAGIGRVEAEKRLKQDGPNRLTKPREIRFWAVFWEEVTEPLILLLLLVGIIYSWWGEPRDAITIFSVIVILVFVEVFTEFRAKRAVASLRKLSPATAVILRDGQYREILTVEIVKGDILSVEAGSRVPSDARIIDSFGLEVDESALTGESTAVAKDDRPVTDETPLADRSCMLFAGTTVTRGRGTAVVTAAGMGTELGKITGLVIEAKEPKTPLQLATKKLAGLLLRVAVFFSVIIPLIGILRGQDWKQMILTGLSLSFAVIPEELPIIITMVLGVGALALSRKNVLIRRLSAAETLGSVTTIATDKTGTLTENKMVVAAIATDSLKTFSAGPLSDPDRLALIIAASTTNVKKIGDDRFLGDPMDVAVMAAAASTGTKAENMKLIKEFSFDNERKMMSSLFDGGKEPCVYARGAPETILARSSRLAYAGMVRPKTAGDEADIRKLAADMAGQAMRVIAFAYKPVTATNLNREAAESDLIFAGMIGFSDPPRAGVKEALQVTRGAGIRTIVVSGDHPLTVQKIAGQVGIESGGRVLTGAEMAKLSDNELSETAKQVFLYARTDPAQKLRIVRALHEAGEVVAVTGDGINDAPALKSADIGVAMGETGTEVAREAASMVLSDDSFNSIAEGVREGRKIWDNLRKGISYYLSVKIALVLSFIVPLALGIVFPFAPIQIIVLELFMDLAASATFVAEPMEPDAMKRPPPDRNKFLDRGVLVNMFLASLSLSAAVLINYLWLTYHGADVVEAQTAAFATWMVGHIFLALVMRSQREPLWKIGLLSNKVMLVWAAAVVAFLAIVTNIGPAQVALKLTALSGQTWLMVVVVPFVTVFWFELKKAFTREPAVSP